jgi:hypothetical protein
MVKTRIVNNRNRPAQPEPDEDPAVKKAPVRAVRERRAASGARTKPLSRKSRTAK